MPSQHLWVVRTVLRPCFKFYDEIIDWFEVYIQTCLKNPPWCLSPLHRKVGTRFSSALHSANSRRFGTSLGRLVGLRVHSPKTSAAGYLPLDRVLNVLAFKKWWHTAPGFTLSSYLRGLSEDSCRDQSIEIAWTYPLIVNMSWYSRAEKGSWPYMFIEVLYTVKITNLQHPNNTHMSICTFEPHLLLTIQVSPKQAPNDFGLPSSFHIHCQVDQAKKSPKPGLLAWAISSDDIVVSYLWSLVLLIGNAQIDDRFSEIFTTATGEIVDYCSTSQCH